MTMAPAHDDGTYVAVGTLSDSDLACEILAGAIPEASAGKWRLLSFQIKEVRKRHRKRIIIGLLSFRNGADSRVRTTEILAKVYGSDRGAKAFQTLKQLWEAGFRSPAKYQVPRPYGYLRKQGTLLQATAPGTAWASSLRADERSLSAGSARAANWLVRLQGSPVSAEARRWESAVESVQHWSQGLALAFPPHAHRLELVAERLSQALRADGIPLVPSHGDYHPMNIFLTPTLTTVIDFDTFSLREAAFDVGYAIGQLLVMSYFQTGGFGPGASAARAFWHRYQTGGRAPWDRVAVQVARTLLQSLHYELCTLCNNRLELLGLWPALMEAWLHSSGPTTLDGLNAIPVQAHRHRGGQ